MTGWLKFMSLGVLLCVWPRDARSGTNTQAVTSSVPVAAVTQAVTNVTALARVETDPARLTDRTDRDVRGPGLLFKFARAGKGLFEEDEGGYLRLRERDSADGAREFKLDSRWLRHLGVSDESLWALPTLRSSVEWDTALGTHELRKVELGVFSDRLWLIHEESDDDASVTGLQLRGTW